MGKRSDNPYPHFVQAQFRGHDRPVLLGIYDGRDAYMVHDAIARLHHGQLGSVRTACPDVFSRLTLTSTSQQLDIAAEYNIDRRTCPRVYWAPGLSDAQSALGIKYGGRPAYVIDCHHRDEDLWVYALEFEDGQQVTVTEREMT